MRHQEQLNTLSQQRVSQRHDEQPDPALDSTIPSMPQTSVGSTRVPTDDALLARYLMDDIQETTRCELHMKMKNISMKVADGFALSNPPEATIHDNPIPPSYVVSGWMKFCRDMTH